MYCGRCGRVLKTKHPPERCHARCRAMPRWHEFGSWLEIWLTIIGITKQRYSAFLFRFGLIEVPDSGCGGCERRKKWLDTFGGKLSQRADLLGRIACRLLVRRIQPMCKRELDTWL